MLIGHSSMATYGSLRSRMGLPLVPQPLPPRKKVRQRAPRRCEPTRPLRRRAQLPARQDDLENNLDGQPLPESEAPATAGTVHENVRPGLLPLTFFLRSPVDDPSQEQLLAMASCYGPHMVLTPTKVIIQCISPSSFVVVPKAGGTP